MNKNKVRSVFLLTFLMIFCFTSFGNCSIFSRYNIETHDNPEINCSRYHSFGFYEDKDTKSLPDYLPNKHLQLEIIKQLEKKGYKHIKNFRTADLVIFLFSSNEYSESASSIPIYQSNNSHSHYSGFIGSKYFHGNINSYGGNSWKSITVTKHRYYPYVGISFIENKTENHEKAWEGSGITATRKSNIEKYGCNIIKKILDKFPEAN